MRHHTNWLLALHDDPLDVAGVLTGVDITPQIETRYLALLGEIIRWSIRPRVWRLAVLISIRRMGVWRRVNLTCHSFHGLKRPTLSLCQRSRE